MTYVIKKYEKNYERATSWKGKEDQRFDVLQTTYMDFPKARIMHNDFVSIIQPIHSMWGGRNLGKYPTSVLQYKSM